MFIGPKYPKNYDIINFEKTTLGLFILLNIVDDDEFFVHIQSGFAAMVALPVAVARPSLLQDIVRINIKTNNDLVERKLLLCTQGELQQQLIM